MTKTINLQISPKYQIGDKLIYFSGPNKNEPIKVKILNLLLEGQFHFNLLDDKVVVSDFSLYQESYALYLLEILEDALSPQGNIWLKKGEILCPSLREFESRSKLIEQKND